MSFRYIQHKYGKVFKRGLKIYIPPMGWGRITKSDWLNYIYVKFPGNKSKKFSYEKIKDCETSALTKFSTLSCGQRFIYRGFNLIRCETITDVSNQTWNAVCLKSGTLFKVKKTEEVSFL